MTALNIKVDVSGLGIYEIEILKQKLALYAQSLVAASKVSKKNESAEKYEHDSLAGIFTDKWSVDDLRNEYIKDLETFDKNNKT